ncbi:uncharacterized protein PV09_08046 [Verruconis gallopava]|uniref:Uncharacterized protein n=1 Tax=Verruconis gallopava TaxID=253628 RepID=A0A0D2A0Z1_9PEZI|nr:uncharacterized protein PV09_08046 [Verruconis gallopava]KIW00333.1 hypothetical protein PV09_08046 [Verruconis gallopava]
MPNQRHKRLDNFKGTVKEYITYLENEVFQLRRRVHHLEQVPTSIFSPTQPQLTPMQIVIEDPSERPKKVTARANKWTSMFWDVLRQNEEGWATRRKQTLTFTWSGLIETISRLTCMRFDVCDQLQTTLGDKTPHDRSTISILRGYGGFVSTLGENRIHATQLFNFGTLLFVSLSIIAIEMGVSKKEVDKCLMDHLQRIQGQSNASEIWLSHLRHTALKIIAWAHDMSETALRHRAWELLFQYIPSIHQTPKVVQGFRVDLSGLVFDLRPPRDEIQAKVPFEIPYLVKIIFGNYCSLKTINKALGTKLREDVFHERLATLKSGGWTRGDPVVVNDEGTAAHIYSMSQAVPRDQQPSKLRHTELSSVLETPQCQPELSGPVNLARADFLASELSPPRLPMRDGVQDSETAIVNDSGVEVANSMTLPMYIGDYLSEGDTLQLKDLGLDGQRWSGLEFNY